MNAPKTQKEKDLDRLLCPDELLEKPENPDFEPDPTGFVPDWARNSAEEKARERRIADGTASVEDLLVPDWAREKKRAADDEADELTPAKQTPAVQTPVEVNEVKISLGEWAEKWAKDQAEKTDNEKLEREIEARKVEDENREIRESFERVIAAKDAARATADLTPDHYKDQE